MGLLKRRHTVGEVFHYPAPLDKSRNTLVGWPMGSESDLGRSSWKGAPAKERLEMKSHYQPIEAYGIIRNMRPAAVGGMDGSIDWLCLPHFDSPSIFAALLGPDKGGRFRIAPAGDSFRRKQF